MLDAYSPRKTAEAVPPLPATDSSIFTPPQPISVGTEPLLVEGGRTVRAISEVTGVRVRQRSPDSSGRERNTCSHGWSARGEGEARGQGKRTTGAEHIVEHVPRVRSSNIPLSDR